VKRESALSSIQLQSLSISYRLTLPITYRYSYRRPALLRPASSPDPIQVQSTGVACVFVNPLFAKYKYAKHMLSLLHYVQAKEEDLPPFPLEQWGEPPVVEEGGEGGWTRDIAFSVRRNTESCEKSHIMLRSS
jgi:hypothetical protein